MKLYGKVWPDDSNRSSIERWCYIHALSTAAGGLGKAGHFKRLILSLFPEKDPFGRRIYIWHPWMDRRVESWCNDKKVVTWWAPAAAAKAQPLDATVMTPTGPVTMGSIRAGDRVLSQDGKTSEVLRVTERREQDCYRVGFSDGTSTECAGDHLWEVSSSGLKWTRNKVVETTWLEKNLKSSGGRPRLSIPTCDPVYFQERKILIDPYVMGVLLGDGSFGGRLGRSSLTFTSADEDIVKQVGDRVGKEYVVVPIVRYQYRIVKKTRINNGENKHISALRLYGLWTVLSDAKFIPDDYLYNSEEIRRDVLSGLMDTDGSAGKNGSLAFSSSSSRLANGVAMLVRSLGGIASISVRAAGYKDRNGYYVSCLPSHLVCFRLPDETRLFKCERKQDRIRARKMSGRMVQSVELVGRKQMRCITIDHPRGLYLTNDFIATHNSTDAAMIALVDWYADPANTTTIICSTTLKMLRRRIFAEVVRFHMTLRLLSPQSPPPGHYTRSKDSFTFEVPTNEDQQNDRSGIFGFAIQQGDKKQAKDDIIGQHNARVRIIIDEAQHPDMEVAFDARSNLAKGADDFKLLAFGNPDSRLTPLGRYSEPAAGWDKINETLESWPTKLGECHYFDGLKSPAMLDPIRYSFLIKKQDIDDEVEDSGMNSPDYWQFARGFVRPEGTIAQIISDTFAIKTKMREEPEWQGDFLMGAGFDPSFSSGGDRRVIVPFQLGVTTAGTLTLAYLTPVDIQIDMTELHDKTFSKQMSERVISLCQQMGIKKNYLGMDTTGAQMTLADFIDELWDEPGAVYRCEFGGKPSEEQATEGDPRKASDVYANRVSELWFNMVAFAKSNQIRRIPIQALKEFTIREMLSADRMKLRTTKRQIETKPAMKERTGGRSPDEADACCVCIDTARARMGFKFSGQTVEGTSRVRQEETTYDNEYDLDGSSKLYLTAEIPTV